MNAPALPGPEFKRQVVFRVTSDDWRLLEAVANEHGSIQAAVMAGLHALSAAPKAEARESRHTSEPGTAPTRAEPTAGEERSRDRDEEEISAREAAEVLGLKTSTVRGYIRSGRLPGRYVGEPDWEGWLTTRGAVEAYLRR